MKIDYNDVVYRSSCSCVDENLDDIKIFILSIDGPRIPCLKGYLFVLGVGACEPWSADADSRQLRNACRNPQLHTCMASLQCDCTCVFEGSLVS